MGLFWAKKVNTLKQKEARTTSKIPNHSKMAPICDVLKFSNLVYS